MFSAIVLAALATVAPVDTRAANEIVAFGPYAVTSTFNQKYAAPAQDTFDGCVPVPKPGGSTTFPGIIFVHGGGWSTGDKGHYDTLCRHWASWGFTAITINYRLTGVAPWPAQIVDVQAAVRWMRAHAADIKLDTTTYPDGGHEGGLIEALGESAGGQLVQYLGYSPVTVAGDLAADNADQYQRVQYVISEYGPSQWGPRAPAGSPDPATVKLLRAFPDYSVKTLIIQGRQDKTVAPDNATVLFDAISPRAVEPILWFDGGHAFRGLTLAQTTAIQNREIALGCAYAAAKGRLALGVTCPTP